jgi:hypothetical protein
MPVSTQTKKQVNHRLPIVTAKTIDAIFHVYAGKKWGKHLTEMRESLIQENPQLVKFIESQVGKYPPALHNILFEVILGVISVLDHQAMVDSR